MPFAMRRVWSRSYAVCATGGWGGRGPFTGGTDRSHLPLRGKLGWMTPWSRSRLGRASGTRLWGFPIPSGAPSFFSIQPSRDADCLLVRAEDALRSAARAIIHAAHAQHQTYDFVRRREFSRVASPAGAAYNSGSSERCRMHHYAGKNCGSWGEPDGQWRARAGTSGALQDAFRSASCGISACVECFAAGGHSHRGCRGSWTRLPCALAGSIQDVPVQNLSGARAATIRIWPRIALSVAS